MERERMSLSRQQMRDIIIELADATNNWCDYLDENDREEESERLEEVLRNIDEIIRYLGG